MKKPADPGRKVKAGPVTYEMASAIVLARYHTKTPDSNSLSYHRLRILAKVFSLSMGAISIVCKQWIKVS